MEPIISYPGEEGVEGWRVMRGRSHGFQGGTKGESVAAARV